MARDWGVRLRALVPGVGLAVLAAAALGWLLPSAATFFVQAPALFWATAALAVLIDAPLFIDPGDDVRVRSTLSVSVCFAILLIWGAGPAVVVQVVAAIVTGIGQRYFALGTVFFTSRLVVAFAAADLLPALAWRRDTFSQGSPVDGEQVVGFIEVVAVWVIVSHGLLVAATAAFGTRRLSDIGHQVRDDLLVSTAVLLLATPLLIVVPHWWSLLVAVPLLALNLARRRRIEEERQLLAEPGTVLLFRRCLTGSIVRLTLQDRLYGQPFVLMVVNVESLLAINHGLGREIYERAVREAAARLRDRYGAEGLGRLTGEAFVLVLTGAPSIDPRDAADDVVRTLTPTVEVAGVPFGLDPAVGVALSPEHGRDLDTLLVKAELAMTRARQEDRTTMVYVLEAAAAARRRVEVLAELYAALRDPARRHEIAVLYQPQVQLATRRLVGVEALVRWTHPEWGPVPTERLIEAVETSDVMHLLTRSVLDGAVAQVRAWNEVGFPVRMSVNANVKDLRNPDFVGEIDTALRSHGVAPGQLTIEITERLVDVDSVRISRACARIVGLGVGLSIDDFGTGYASLAQLRLLPVREVKVDQSYVRGVLNDPSARAIVTSVHQLCAALGLDLVAEGVEDERIASALAEFGGAIGQGWHFGRPMPAEELYAQWRDALLTLRS